MIKGLKCFKDKPKLAEFFDFLLICTIIVVLVKILTLFIILTGYVPSESMENLILKEDRILANRMAYWNSGPERGDIAVFYSPDDKAMGNEKYFVKRVIGLPGETVTIKDNKVYIDEKLIKEVYLPDDMVTTAPNEGVYRVPEGHYFMMGDNRTNSHDSRTWTNHYVPLEDICGKVFFKYSLKLSNFHFKTISSYHDYEYVSDYDDGS